jgi:hypothetical protein
MKPSTCLLTVYNDYNTIPCIVFTNERSGIEPMVRTESCQVIILNWCPSILIHGYLNLSKYVRE